MWLAERLSAISRPLEETFLDHGADRPVGIGQIEAEERAMDAALAPVRLKCALVLADKLRAVAGDHLGKDEVLDLDRTVCIADPALQGFIAVEFDGCAKGRKGHR
jgi:hypothetical protein